MVPNILCCRDVCGWVSYVAVALMGLKTKMRLGQRGHDPGSHDRVDLRELDRRVQSKDVVRRDDSAAAQARIHCPRWANRGCDAGACAQATQQPRGEPARQGRCDASRLETGQAAPERHECDLDEEARQNHFGYKLSINVDAKYKVIRQ